MPIRFTVTIFDDELLPLGADVIVDADDPLSPVSMPEFVTANVNDDNAGNKSSACDILEPWTFDVTDAALVEFSTLVIVVDEFLEVYHRARVYYVVLR